MRVDVLLHEYLDAVRVQRFRPGKHDCALFVGGWVKRYVGKDLTQDLGGQYRTLDEGRRMLAELGFNDLASIAAANFSEIPVAMAQVGDVVLVNENAFGIVAGERVFVLRPDGLGHIARSEAEKAFRIQ